jgi:hypothetical protein
MKTYEVLVRRLNGGRLVVLRDAVQAEDEGAAAALALRAALPSLAAADRYEVDVKLPEVGWATVRSGEVDRPAPRQFRTTVTVEVITDRPVEFRTLADLAYAEEGGCPVVMTSQAANEPVGGEG